MGMRRRRTRLANLSLLLGGLVVTGCSASSVGEVGLLMRAPDAVGTKLLRPEAAARSCQSFVLGLPMGPDISLDDAVERILALDSEGNAIANVHLSWSRLRAGLYDRDCLEVRGDLVRTISTVTLPHHADHQQ